MSPAQTFSSPELVDPNSLNRRQLLQLAGGTLGASLIASATRGSVQAQSASSSVLVLKTADRVAGIRQVLDELQPNFKGKGLFVKPNYNTGDPAPAATDTDLLAALLDDCQQSGCFDLTIGDRSGMASTRQAMQRKGVFELADRLGAKTLVFDEMAADQWQYFPADGTHWQQGFAFARPILSSEAIVNTCCLKTHRFGGHFTLSLKNTVGMVAKYVPGDPFNYMRDLHSSPHQRLMIAEINQVYQPDLVVIDGIDAFVDGGPEAGTQVEAQVMLAGTDRVAVDAVAIAMLRVLGTTATVNQGSIWQLEQVQRAVELGLGASSPDQIELITVDAPGAALADQLRPQLV